MCLGLEIMYAYVVEMVSHTSASWSDLPVSRMSTLLASFFLGLVCVCVHLWCNKRPVNYPPGPWRLPFIGNMHQLGTRPFVKFMSMRKKYGDIIAIDFASYRGVVLNDAKLIREALAMPEFAGRPKVRPFMERYNEGKLRGILLDVGPTHSQLRRFALRTLRDFGMGRKSMEALIQDELHELTGVLAKYEQDELPFETKCLFNLASFNSLWWIINGERFEYEDERLQTILKNFTEGLTDTPGAGAAFFFPWLTRLAPNLTGYNQFMKAQHQTHVLIWEKYLEQRASFTSGRHRHVMDVYIQELVDAIESKETDSIFYGKEGEKNLVASISDIFEAGIETTSTTMSWCVLLLALHPFVQDKMYAEVKTLTQLSRPTSLDDLPRLPYIQSVLNEILRYSSIVALSIFHSTLEDVEFHGYKIPKDTMVMPNLHGVHHDPAIWGDPQVFRPERFLTADGKFSKKEALMPFSLGKRGCIGESLARNTLFLFLTTVYTRFRILPNPKKPSPVVDYAPSFVLQPKSYEYVVESRLGPLGAPPAV